MSCRLLPMLLLAGLCACGNEEERQPTAEEVQRYTREIERAEAAATAKAVQEAQAKEKAASDRHLARVPAQN